MERPRILPIVLALAAAAAVCMPTAAQTERTVPETELKSKPVDNRVRPMPFSIDGVTSGRISAIEFRPFDRMSEKDRDLAADGEASIGEHAGFAGLEFNEGQWSYQQIVCPALPNHLFLQFTRNNGARDVSLFSASVPRGGEGRVRIIPIQRPSYSLFSPAPINALTVSAFNHIRREEHIEQAPDWLGTGLCYAALAGARPVAAPPVDEATPDKLPIAPPAVLVIANNGGAVIRFTDVAASAQPMEWTMTFNGKGTLLKATHFPASLLKVRAVQPAAVDEKGTVIHPAPVDLNGKPIP